MQRLSVSVLAVAALARCSPREVSRDAAVDSGSDGTFDALRMDGPAFIDAVDAAVVPDGMDATTEADAGAERQLHLPKGDEYMTPS
jgi:hypothetical protein